MYGIAAITPLSLSWGQAEFDFIMWVYKVQSPVNDLIVGLPGDAIEQFDGASGALYIQ